MPLLVDVLLAFGSTIVAALVGLRFGRRMRSGLTDGERSQLFTLEASLLGLLALLLGFSFAMAETRYDLRKQLVVDEGNAIGTAWLRAGVFDDAHGRQIQALLEDYVATRLHGYRAREPARLRGALAESERLQREIWSHASAIAAANPQSEMAALLLQALNDVIDLHAKRIAAGQNHIPPLVLMALLLVAAATMGWVGAGIGVSGRRGTAPALVLSVLISTVMTVIVDLDQPRSGIVRVTQATLSDLERTFARGVITAPPSK